MTPDPNGSLREIWQYGRLVPMPERVPPGWAFTKLTEVARLESGHTPSRKRPEYWSGDIPWVSLHDSKVLDRPEIHQTAQTMGELGLANSSARMLPAGTVVFSRTATVGKCTILGREMATSQDFANYVCGPSVHNRFLMHLMRFLQPEWNRLMAGSTHNTIYMPVFEGLQVLLPPNKEQRKIAAILCSLDEAIESTQAVINQLGVVKKAMMAELLTRGLPGRHSKFKMTEIGEVPEEWDVVPLRECLREPTRNGYSPVCPATPTGKWILHLGAVTFDGFNHQATKPAPLDDRKVDANVLELGDLVVSRSNTRERVGLAGLYRGAPSPCSYPDLLMRVRPAARLLPEFLESVLLSPRARSFFSSSARGTSESMVKINRDLLESLPVQVPPKDEQLAMSDALTLLADRRGAELIALAGMRGLRLALMSVLLTGEVRVKPDKEVA